MSQAPAADKHSIHSAETSLILGDAFELVKSLDRNAVKLTITSPPYNLGKAYERRASLNDYLLPYREFATKLFEKTADEGHVCWEVGNYVDDGEVYPLDIFFYDVFKSAGFKLRNRIIWHFEHGLHASKRFSGRYETILWFSKSDSYTFNLDPVRVPSKYPGKTAWKGPNKGRPTGNPLGKNPSDLWRVVESDWKSEIWDIPNVKANHPEKTVHPCQFPIELVERCVLALTNPRDLVLDPFAGVGSSAIAARLHARRFVGFDSSEQYLDIANSRLRALGGGTLRIRPIGKPVYKPTGREKVAQVPKSWVAQTE